MSSSEPRRATARERKRRSRGDLSDSHREKERVTSRRRMAVYRARKKAQNHLLLLKLRLGVAERAAVEARSEGKRHEVLCDWFRSHGVRFDARIRFTKEVVDSFVSKEEMHQIELLVAEYEIALITGVAVGGDAFDEGGNHQAPSSTDRGGGRGSLTKGVATANSKRGVVNALQGRQQQGGSIGPRGLTEANSTRAGAFGGSNYQAPSITTREGDRGKLLKKFITPDLTSTQAFVGSSYQKRMKGEIKHYLPSQISGDGDSASTSHPDSAGTRLFDPRLSEEQVNDFLSCFGGNFAEESTRTYSSSSDPRTFGDGSVQAVPNSDEIDCFFANFQTVKGEDIPAILPANEEEDTGPAPVFADALQQQIDSLEAELETKVFGESNLLDTAPSSTGAETIPPASSRSIFGEQGPGPVGPSKTAVVCGEGIAPAGGEVGNVLSGRSVDGDGAGIYSEGVAPAGSCGGNAVSGGGVVSHSAGICGEGVAPGGGGGGEVFPGRSVDGDGDIFDTESLGECVDSDLLQW